MEPTVGTEQRRNLAKKADELGHWPMAVVLACATAQLPRRLPSRLSPRCGLLVGLCAEVGEFQRFHKPRQLMSYLGLTPSEDTSGEKRRQGAITKTGSRHARRLLVEAAWHYRSQPRIGRALSDRQNRQPPEAIAIAWTAQRRLHRVWTRLEQRTKRRTIIAVAAARELAGFCWAITQIE